MDIFSSKIFVDVLRVCIKIKYRLILPRPIVGIIYSFIGPVDQVRAGYVVLDDTICGRAIKAGNNMVAAKFLNPKFFGKALKAGNRYITDLMFDDLPNLYNFIDAIPNAIKSGISEFINYILERMLKIGINPCSDSSVLSAAYRTGNINIIYLAEILDVPYTDKCLIAAFKTKNWEIIQRASLRANKYLYESLLYENGYTDNIDSARKFYHACKIGDLNTVKSFAEILDHAPLGMLIACDNNQVNIVAYISTLADFSYEITFFTKNVLDTNCSVDILRFLLGNKIIKPKDAFYVACSKGYTAYVRELIAAHGPIPESCIIGAAIMGHMDILSLAQLNLRLKNKILIMACQLGYHFIAKKMIAEGATDWGTALCTVINYGS